MNLSNLSSRYPIHEICIRKTSIVIVRENFNFWTCIVFEISRLDCFLFVAHNAETGNYSLLATIIRFALVAFCSISLLLIQRRFTSGAFSFDRSTLRLDDKQFTSAKKRLHFSRRIRVVGLNGNEISARQKGASCHYIYLLNLYCSIRRNMALYDLKGFNDEKCSWQ